ncbi:hypothetical protein [Streptomyces inhibens]|uniref:hypothetical protein n=1 Tax=Streptomyces inhibens TaxID=2293571 RepID=UPI001EE6DF73|nr:hypothetical protein [Streptomyces inhibens]UKY54485.1 hypothetical protein KI385_40570 [Streptomyces inhibens]
MAFGGCSLYWIRDTLLPDDISDWAPVGGWFVPAGVLVTLCVRWSCSRGWGAAHCLALAGAALLTYVRVGFLHAWETDVPRATGVLGNLVFGAGALIQLAVAARARDSKVNMTDRAAGELAAY